MYTRSLFWGFNVEKFAIKTCQVVSTQNAGKHCLKLEGVITLLQKRKISLC